MPEMPEVEQVRKSLTPFIRGKRIKNTEVLDTRIIKGTDVAQFINNLCGRTILGVDRKGKYLVLQFDKNFLVVHLRLTGALLALPKGAVPPYQKVHFVLDGDRDLWFTDIRGFGTLDYVSNPMLIKGYATLGPEPLTSGFTSEYLQTKGQKSQKPVKTFILDQSVIAGLGNIYADECLFLARIRPLRAVNSLTKEDYFKLTESINAVIAQGIKNHGTTFRDYKDGEGKSGSNQKYLNVYGRGGQPCKKCGKQLTKITVGGRGTVFCEVCQK